jgi:hypothetical protein
MLVVRLSLTMVLLLAGLLLAGCGGEEEPATGPPEPTVTEDAPFGGATTPGGEGTTVESATQVESLEGTEFTLNTAQPVSPEFRAAYQRRAVILVEFFKPEADFTEGDRVNYPQGLSVDQEVHEAVQGLRAQYPQVEFFSYDITRPGTAQTSEDLRRGQYGSLAAQLNVGFTPFVAILAPREEGYFIENLWQGYVERGVINQALFQLASEELPGNASRFAVTLENVQLTPEGGGIEFFTVTNEGQEDINLRGWSLRVLDPASGVADAASPGVQVSASIPVAPGESVSVGRTPDLRNAAGDQVAGIFQGGRALDLRPGVQLSLLDGTGAVAATTTV